jgi:molybdopterin converting factor subunit 1
MRVRIRLFAALREEVGQPELELELADGASPEAAWCRLVREHPALERHRRGLAVAVNLEYGSFEETLRDEDELAFIPPVAGG